MKSRIAALLLFGLLGACATPATRMYVVRHAEKAPDPGDGNPELSEAGHQRAAELARVLADVPLTHIIATDLVRTQQTAAPTAAAHGLTPEILPSEDIDGLVARLRQSAPGARVLVVGHSHTLPKVLAQLGQAGLRIDSGDYDDLFVLDLVGGHSELDRLHVGPQD